MKGEIHPPPMEDGDVLEHCVFCDAKTIHSGPEGDKKCTGKWAERPDGPCKAPTPKEIPKMLEEFRSSSSEGVGK